MARDVVLLVPFEPQETAWLDPVRRRTQTAAQFAAVRARHRLEEELGGPLDDVLRRAQSTPDGRHGFRSTSAVILASSLERAGLRWHAVDPGVQSLSYWRHKIRSLRRFAPRMIAVNTTFIVEVSFVRLLCALIRRELPEAKLGLGGYLYATSSEAFLRLDADIFCIGEGEQRIVSIARAVRQGHGLEQIRGLYLRAPDGRLTFTGEPEPLPLESLPIPDWRLSRRMDPPYDPVDVALDHVVETQRGCVFKCAFCTFRTLSPLQMTSVERAVDLLLAPAPYRVMRLELADATATYPRERWRAILRELVARGGSPHPLMIYARVSDLDAEVCALMKRAGVRIVFVGQEVGDQTLLNAMRKGTRVEQVAPALAALAEQRIAAIFGFIHGFPGESAATLRATRDMLLSLNDQSGELPVVPSVRVEPFMAQDFAAVAQRRDLSGVEHPYGYGGAEVMASGRATREVLRTFIELSRHPRAPATAFALHRAVWTLADIADEGQRLAAFRWFKAFDRGIGALAAHDVFGEPLDRAAVAGSVAALKSSPWGAVAELRRGPRLAVKLRHLLIARLSREWHAESERGVGPLTRALVGAELFRATGSAALAQHGVTHADLGAVGWHPAGSHEARAERALLAEQLVELGVATGRQRPRAAAAFAAHRAAR